MIYLCIARIAFLLKKEVEFFLLCNAGQKVIANKNFDNGINMSVI